MEERAACRPDAKFEARLTHRRCRSVPNPSRLAAPIETCGERRLRPNASPIHSISARNGQRLRRKHTLTMSNAPELDQLLCAVFDRVREGHLPEGEDAAQY